MIVDDTGTRQQLGHDRLVHVAVLPQVEHREMEAEHVDATPQRVETAGGERDAPWVASDVAIVSRSARNAAGVAYGAPATLGGRGGE